MMLKWSHLDFLFVLTCFLHVRDGVCYKVSVVEYKHQYDSQISSHANLLRNTQAHVNIIKFLKGKSELVVFPDGSLSKCSGSSAVYLELPSASFTRDTYSHKTLNDLSAAAKYSNMYVVACLPEKFGKQLYCSYLVFRRNGTIAAKYRKNDMSAGLYKTEPVYFDTDMGLRFGLITSLDVLFPSPAIDLIKQKVRYFVYPTGWPSRLPFFTANAIQHGWSWSNDVTVLAAGLNNVQSSRTGSGIFTGKRGHMSRLPIRYVTTTSPTTQVITGSLDPSRTSDDQVDGFYSRTNLLNNRVPGSAFETSLLPEDEELRYTSSPLSLGKTSLDSYTTLLLAPDRNCNYHMFQGTQSYRCRVLEKLCHGDLCCEFDVIVDYMICDNPCLAETAIPHLITEDSFYFFRYRLAVFDGIESPWKGSDSLGVQICSVVSCLNKQIGSCGEKPNPAKYSSPIYTIMGRTVKSWAQSISVVNITGNFTTNNSTLIMPTLLFGETSNRKNPNRFGVLSNNFILEPILGNKTRLLLPDQKRNLATAGILNRIFSRDGRPTSSSSSLSSSFILSTTVFLLPSLPFFIIFYN